MKTVNKIIEQIFCYLFSATYFTTFIWLVTFKGWDFKWLFFSTFISFLFIGFCKLDVDSEPLKKDSIENKNSTETDKK